MKFSDVLAMNNNDSFARLLALTELRQNEELLIRLLEEKGCNVSSAKIRSWRRPTVKSNSRPVPGNVLEALFEILSDEKNRDKTFCRYPSGES